MEGLGIMMDFFKGKSIFLTGHTGFKGSWLSRILQLVGANITGYALAHPEGSSYGQVVDENAISSYIGDVRDFDALKKVFDAAKSEIVFHLAAQPLVIDAFGRPAYTFDVNVQGTVNLLECIRQSETVKSVVIVTTDKVYHNNEWVYGYRENDMIGDTEPYAASKACAEIVAASYYETFLKPKGMALSTVRAGNVIGGGDISKNRIVPDCVRAAKQKEPIIVRNPYSVRPYQHVLEPLFAYLLIAQRQSEDIKYAGQYNIGPAESDCITTAELADVFCREWGENQSWQNVSRKNAPQESNLLKLDCSKMRSTFNWHPKWDVETAIAKTIEWERFLDKKEIIDRQVNEYAELVSAN